MGGGAVRRPEEGDFFRVRGDAAFFYVFKGSKTEDRGGVIGEVFQARRAAWDDTFEALDEIADGGQEWVQTSAVRKIYPDRAAADDEALDERLREGLG